MYNAESKDQLLHYRINPKASSRRIDLAGGETSHTAVLWPHVKVEVPQSLQMLYAANFEFARSLAPL
jgi:hypothetical protein